MQLIFQKLELLNTSVSFCRLEEKTQKGPFSTVLILLPGVLLAWNRHRFPLISGNFSGFLSTTATLWSGLHAPAIYGMYLWLNVVCWGTDWGFWLDQSGKRFFSGVAS